MELTAAKKYIKEHFPHGRAYIRPTSKFIGLPNIDFARSPQARMQEYSTEKLDATRLPIEVHIEKGLDPRTGLPITDVKILSIRFVNSGGLVPNVRTDNCDVSGFFNEREVMQALVMYPAFGRPSCPYTLEPWSPDDDMSPEEVMSRQDEFRQQAGTDTGGASTTTQPEGTAVPMVGTDLKLPQDPRQAKNVQREIHRGVRHGAISEALQGDDVYGVQPAGSGEGLERMEGIKPMVPQAPRATTKKKATLPKAPAAPVEA